MRYTGATGKQKRYAHYLMNEGMSRAECARQAGYSKTMIDNPKKIEESNGFALAMATVAGQTGKTYLKALYALENKDLTQENVQTLLKAVDVLSNAWTRFIPKNKTSDDSNLISIFDNVIDVSDNNIGLDKQENVLFDNSNTTIDKEVNVLSYGNSVGLDKMQEDGIVTTDEFDSVNLNDNTFDSMSSNMS